MKKIYEKTTLLFSGKKATFFLSLLFSLILHMGRGYLFFECSSSFANSQSFEFQSEKHPEGVREPLEEGFAPFALSEISSRLVEVPPYSPLIFSESMCRRVDLSFDLSTLSLFNDHLSRSNPILDAYQNLLKTPIRSCFTKTALPSLFKRVVHTLENVKEFNPKKEKSPFLKELKIGFDDRPMLEQELKGLFNKKNRFKAVCPCDGLLLSAPPSLLSSAPLLLCKRMSSRSRIINLKKLHQNLDMQFKTGPLTRSPIPKKETLTLKPIKHRKDLNLLDPSPADLADLITSSFPSHITFLQRQPIAPPLSRMTSPYLSVLFPSKKQIYPSKERVFTDLKCTPLSFKKLPFYHTQRSHVPKKETLTLKPIKQGKDLNLLVTSPADLADLMVSSLPSRVTLSQTKSIIAPLSRVTSPHLSVLFTPKKGVYPSGKDHRLNTLCQSKEVVFRDLKWIPLPFKKLPFYHPPLRKPLITGGLERLNLKKFSPNFLQKGVELRKFSTSLVYFDSIFSLASSLNLQKHQKIKTDREICFNLFYLPKLEEPCSIFSQKRAFPAFQEREKSGLMASPSYPNLERGGTCSWQEEKGKSWSALLNQGEKGEESFSLSMPSVLFEKGGDWLKEPFFTPKRSVQRVSEIKGLALSTPSPPRLQTFAPPLMTPSTEPNPFGFGLERVIKGGRGIEVKYFSNLGLKTQFKEDLSEGSVRLGLSHPELKVALSEKEVHNINQIHRVTEGYLRDTFSEKEIKVLSFENEFETTLTYFEKAEGKGYDFALTLKPDKRFQAPPLAKNFIFVLDCSASIKKHRYTTFKEAIIKAASYMTSGDLFNVILADSKIRSMSKKPIAWSQERVNQVRSYLDRSEYRGYFANRNTFRLIDEIENYFDSEKENVVVLLTDGNSLKQLEKQKNAFKALAKKSKGLFSLFTASASQGNNITMLDLISTFNNGEFMYSPTHAAFPRKLAIFVRHIKRLVAKDIYIQALAKDGAKVRFYPHREAYPSLYSDTPYTVYGSIDRLDDFDLILQGRLKTQWVNIQQSVSFASAEKVNITFERNFALQKAYSYYSGYLKENDPSLLKKAEEILKQHHLYSQIK